MLVLTAGLGVWQLLVWLPWVRMPLLLSTRSCERVAVQSVYRFRTLTTRQEQQLGPVRTAALDRCGLPPDQFDWYVSPGRQPNACVAGRRSIAVTDGALQTFLAGRLPADLLAAVLVHELGHHATRASRCRLGAACLAAPGRFAFGLIMRLSIELCGGRRPGPATALLALIAMGNGPDPTRPGPAVAPSGHGHRAGSGVRPHTTVGRRGQPGQRTRRRPIRPRRRGRPGPQPRPHRPQPVLTAPEPVVTTVGPAPTRRPPHRPAHSDAKPPAASYRRTNVTPGRKGIVVLSIGGSE